MLSRPSGEFVSEQVFVPGPDTSRNFRSALGRFPTGVTVVTAMTDDGPVGMTVNSFASVSLDPPLVLWSPAKAASRYPLFMAAQHFAIHVLGEEQGDVCDRFIRGGRDFTALDWHTNDEGAPVITGTLARFECRLAAVHDGGDHSIIIGHVLRAAHRDGAPLCVSQGTFGRFAAQSLPG